MPLTLPDLDDRAFADLVAEARALIPALAPGWTDHNPADPGITLIELFAWLTEMLLYRVDQVSDNSRLASLRLINGPGWRRTKSVVAEEIRDTVVRLRTPARAVTAADFERIARGVPGVARAYCVPRCNLELGTRADRMLYRPADVSVVVVPTPDPEPAAHLLDELDEILGRVRLLTTRVHVVVPRPVAIGFDLTVRERAGTTIVDWRRDPPGGPIRLAVTVHARSDQRGDQLLEEAEKGLRGLLDSYRGGPDELGWPFGRAIYVSEIWERLARLPGADYVTEPELEAAPSEAWRLLTNPRRGREGVRLDPDELPVAAISDARAHRPSPAVHPTSPP